MTYVSAHLNISDSLALKYNSSSKELTVFMGNLLLTFSHSHHATSTNATKTYMYSRVLAAASTPNSKSTEQSAHSLHGDTVSGNSTLCVG